MWDSLQRINFVAIDLFNSLSKRIWKIQVLKRSKTQIRLPFQYLEWYAEEMELSCPEKQENLP
jgi:hypothetical protein